MPERILIAGGGDGVLRMQQREWRVFLHDVVMNSCAQTGFGDGLYGDEERDAKAIGDKAGKIAFLAKALTLTGICAGAPLTMQPSKVVAGLEPEDTNACSELAQLEFKSGF